LALAALGLDPGIGVLHNDLRSRDSLACDLMEPVRPQVDAYLLDWLARGPLKRDWFFEQRDGNCRLMGSFAAKLSESAPIWRKAVAPFAEGIARALWSPNLKGRAREAPSTPLTQSRKREARGIAGDKFRLKPVRADQPTLCGICGTETKPGYKHCRKCAPTIWRENILKASKIGRQSTHNPAAQAKRAETQRRQSAALKVWNPANLPAWLDENFYRQKIQPYLGGVKVPAIQSAISVSEPYALGIRRGRYIPHPRHWEKLSRLVTI
jgi:hypothetical protein